VVNGPQPLLGFFIQLRKADPAFLSEVEHGVVPKSCFYVTPIFIRKPLPLYERVCNKL
jgi:hypothetical protein